MMAKGKKSKEVMAKGKKPKERGDGDKIEKVKAKVAVKVTRHSHYHEIIGEIKDKLSAEQKTLMRSMACGPLILDVPRQKMLWQLVHHILQNEMNPPVAQSANDSTMWFRFGRSIVRFGPLEFALCTGLEIFDDHEATLRQLPERLPRLASIVKRCGNLDGDGSFSLRDFRLTFPLIMDVDDLTMVKIALSMFVACVLSSKQSSKSVDLRILHLVDDVAAWNKFPWGGFAYDHTMKWLKSRIKDNESGTYSVGGFPWAFQAWALECLPSIRSSNWVIRMDNKPAGLPRIYYWMEKETGHMVTYEKVHDLFSSPEFVIRDLQPTAEEAKRLHDLLPPPPPSENDDKEASTSHGHDEGVPPPRGEMWTEFSMARERWAREEEERRRSFEELHERLDRTFGKLHERLDREVEERRQAFAEVHEHSDRIESAQKIIVTVLSKMKPDHRTVDYEQTDIQTPLPPLAPIKTGLQQAHIQDPLPPSPHPQPQPQPQPSQMSQHQREEEVGVRTYVRKLPIRHSQFDHSQLPLKRKVTRSSNLETPNTDQMKKKKKIVETIVENEVPFGLLFDYSDWVEFQKWRSHGVNAIEGVDVRTDAQPKIINLEGLDSVEVALEIDRYLPHHPAKDPTWIGNFKVDSYIVLDGIQAHPPCKVHSNTYEFSKQLPNTLQFEQVPRLNLLADLFKDHIPSELEIEMYFFPSTRCEQSYACLVEYLDIGDLVLRSYINGAELFIFSSKHLQEKSQRINQKYFLWGIFRVSEETKVEHMDINKVGAIDMGRIDVCVPRTAEVARGDTEEGEITSQEKTTLVPECLVGDFESQREFQRSFGGLIGMLHKEEISYEKVHKIGTLGR